MKYYLIVGEASGDLHASNLMRAIKEMDFDAEFRFFGGDLMAEAGGTLVGHYRDMAYMGFVPVVLNLGKIFRNMRRCKQDLRDHRPDVVILVDYPGFNLKIAKFVKKRLAVPVCYYISPKIWAWKQWRIRTIRNYVDRMLCILPFEVEFYRQHYFEATYVGNPTVDAVEQRDCRNESFESFVTSNQLPDQPIIALLPGSRKQEIKDNLPTMLDAASEFPEYQLLIAGAPGIEPAYYLQYVGQHRASIVFGQTYRLLQQASVALVTSGTATLETALFRVPQLVCYKTPLKRLTSFVFKHFFTVRYISLVNLIADENLVKELFASSFSREAISHELDALLNHTAYRDKILKGYDRIIELLGAPHASAQAAKQVVKLVKVG